MQSPLKTPTLRFASLPICSPSDGPMVRGSNQACSILWMCNISNWMLQWITTSARYTFPVESGQVCDGHQCTFGCTVSNRNIYLMPVMPTAMWIMFSQHWDCSYARFIILLHHRRTELPDRLQIYHGEFPGCDASWYASNEKHNDGFGLDHCTC